MTPAVFENPIFWLIVIFVALFFVWLIYRYLLFLSDEGGGPFRDTRFPREEYYVRGQLILVGLEDRHSTIARQFGLASVRDQNGAVLEIEFAELGSALSEACADFPQDLVIRLYEISGLFSSVTRRIREINDYLREEGIFLKVTPNWLTGQPFEPEGAPFEPEGAPFEPEGAPFEPEGAGLRGEDRTATPQQFTEQWAFSTIGLDRVQTQTTQREAEPGEGVRVGVFDTSPFDRASDASQPVNLPPIDTSLLVHPATRHNTWLDHQAIQDPGGKRNHGLFVSGLIERVAPGVEIHLFRVLENDNRGELFTLLLAVFDFLKGVAGNPPQNGAVINLSLGIRVPPGEAKFGLPTELVALQFLMDAAYCLNVVTVSAAGNNSARAPRPLLSSLPGGMSGVIGVSASNSDLRRACFSNGGEVGAPGGDGRTNNGDEECKPLVDLTNTLIGPVVLQDFSDPSRISFHKWAGTSFATPLVSGLAARLLSKARGNATPFEVTRCICCTATPVSDPYLGAGVINIPAAEKCYYNQYQDSGREKQEEQTI